MPKLFLLRLEVSDVMRIGFDADRDLLDNFEAVTFETDDFPGVVGEEADAFETEIDEDLGTDAVLAEVHAVAEFLIRLDGVETIFLEFVGLNLRRETNTAAFLSHIKNYTTSGF